MRMPQNISHDESTLAQVMTCCRREASHYLNQYWNIVNWNLGDNLQWNINRNSLIFIQERSFQIVDSEMVAILSRSHCVKGISFSMPLPRCRQINNGINKSLVALTFHKLSLQWRHNERDGVSNHRRIECLLNRLYRRRSKKAPRH